MNVLMLGATGYLGSNIVHALSDNGHEVTCIVRENSRRDVLEGLAGVRFIMNDDREIEYELSVNVYDWVINSVCIYRQNDSLYWDMFSANLIFPLKVLNMAAKYHVRNYMNMGTSLPDGFNMYSFSKARLSELGRYISEHEGLINFVELRLEMFYGNYIRGGGYHFSRRFIEDCIDKLKHNEPVNLTEGTQRRDIIHVEDVIKIVLLIMSMGIKGFRSLPVGTGEQHSIREIVTFLHDTTQSHSQINFGAVPTRMNEPDTLANISWYDEVGFGLKYSFFGGLKHECNNISQT